MQSELSGLPDKPRSRRTKSQVAQLESQIYEVLHTDHPQSVRHVFYRMTDPRLPEPVEKSERGYQQVQTRMTLMRRRGIIPYGWISDATRRGYHVATYSDTAEFLRSMSGLYRANLWEDQWVYPEVWTESRSIAGVIQDDCEELAVSLYPAGGFTSLTFAYEAAENINAIHNGRDVVIYYIGDYDPAGVLIDGALERELRLHLDSEIALDFRRLAITLEQIAQYDLPGKPRKEGDRRRPDILETVEAEALPAHILRATLREEIESLLPDDALVTAKAAEESEQEFILSLARVLDHTDDNKGKDDDG